MAWQSVPGHVIPPHAVVMGTTADGEKLYIGRALHDGTLTPGKVKQSLPNMDDKKLQTCLLYTGLFSYRSTLIFSISVGYIIEKKIFFQKLRAPEQSKHKIFIYLSIFFYVINILILNETKDLLVIQ